MLFHLRSCIETRLRASTRPDPPHTCQAIVVLLAELVLNSSSSSSTPTRLISRHIFVEDR